jgi:hypothetical protein
MQTRSKSIQTKNNQKVYFSTTNVSTSNNEIPVNLLTQMEGIRTRAQLRAAANNAKTSLRHSPRLNGNLPDYSSFF